LFRWLRGPAADLRDWRVDGDPRLAIARRAASASDKGSSQSAPGESIARTSLRSLQLVTLPSQHTAGARDYAARVTASKTSAQLTSMLPSLKPLMRRRPALSGA